jgi:BON domain
VSDAQFLVASKSQESRDATQELDFKAITSRPGVGFLWLKRYRARVYGTRSSNGRFKHMKRASNHRNKGESALQQDSSRFLFGHAPVGGAPVRHPPRPITEFDRERTSESQQRSDERIQLAVITALHWDLAVPSHGVRVRVDRGWVTLTGRVRRAYEKSCAEADARMTLGVVGVTNEIECKPAE